MVGVIYRALEFISVRKFEIKFHGEKHADHVNSFLVTLKITLSVMKLLLTFRYITKNIVEWNKFLMNFKYHGYDSQ